jgi:hypothetical protein
MNDVDPAPRYPVDAEIYWRCRYPMGVANRRRRVTV